MNAYCIKKIKKNIVCAASTFVGGRTDGPDGSVIQSLEGRTTALQGFEQLCQSAFVLGSATVGGIERDQLEFDKGFFPSIFLQEMLLKTRVQRLETCGYHPVLIACQNSFIMPNKKANKLTSIQITSIKV